MVGRNATNSFACSVIFRAHSETDGEPMFARALELDHRKPNPCQTELENVCDRVPRRRLRPRAHMRGTAARMLRNRCSSTPERPLRSFQNGRSSAAGMGARMGRNPIVAVLASRVETRVGWIEITPGTGEQGQRDTDRSS